MRDDRCDPNTLDERRCPGTMVDTIFWIPDLGRFQRECDVCGRQD